MRALLFFSLLFSGLARADDTLTIRSGVPPEFPDGLYTKFLTYLAEQMDMQLQLSPMPFARRLRAMRTGEIDIMVGMQQADENQDEIIYLHPSYESLRHTFFILKENTHKLQSFEDLRQLSIGVTIHAVYFQRFNAETDLAMVPVSSLSQKIGLLRKGRIDTFIHFQESTLPTLKRRGLDGEIVVADFQTTERNNYYFTLSEYSPLFPYRKKFESVIAQGVERGDFAKIREQHYANK